ncbi:MAG TPA: hypothetical protein PL101_06055 [Bacteroidales bacterium]|jgi:hypothetical protein|nr:hypothetical protein [Bacteroidales bacterium]
MKLTHTEAISNLLDSGIEIVDKVTCRIKQIRRIKTGVVNVF